MVCPLMDFVKANDGACYDFGCGCDDDGGDGCDDHQCSYAGVGCDGACDDDSDDDGPCDFDDDVCDDYYEFDDGGAGDSCDDGDGWQDDGGDCFCGCFCDNDEDCNCTIESPCHWRRSSSAEATKC